MEDPKPSQASSSDTLSLGRNRGPIWDPQLSAPIFPQFTGYPFSACAGQKTLIRSIDPHLPFRSTPYRLGTVGPKVGQKWGSNCKIRPQWPRNRCIQFLLQKCEIGVILSDTSRYAQPTPFGMHHPGHPS